MEVNLDTRKRVLAGGSVRSIRASLREVEMVSCELLSSQLMAHARQRNLSINTLGYLGLTVADGVKI